jgi:hypothetical protein
MNSRSQSGSNTLNELRKRLQQMNDAELVRFCRVCSQQLNMGAALSETLVEFEEAEAEWRRRQRRWLT